MKKIMLVGKTGSGKTTLTQALQGLDITYKKTQAVSYCSSIIDTPGEYVENRRYYSALLSSSMNCDFIALVQDGTDGHSVFPPKFASMFSGKDVIGIVSKTDMETCNHTRAEKFLRWAGVEKIIFISSICNLGINDLKMLLS